MAGQDIRKRLPAGGAQPVNVSGDYIYCKFADRPISIIINGGRSGQTRVTMESGDKYRPGPFGQFEVENPDPDRPAQIILTVGEGDYNRQIVKGELTVAPGIKESDGTWKADRRQEIGGYLVPQYPSKPRDFDAGDKLASYSDSTMVLDGEERSVWRNLAIWTEGNYFKQLLFFGDGSKAWVVERTLNKDLQLVSDVMVRRVKYVNYIYSAFKWDGQYYFINTKYGADENAKIQQPGTSTDPEVHDEMVTVYEFDDDPGETLEWIWSAAQHPDGVALALDYQQAGGEALRIIKLSVDPQDVQVQTVRSYTKSEIAESGDWSGLACAYYYDPTTATWSVNFHDSDKHAIYSEDLTEQIQYRQDFYEGEVDASTSSVNGGRVMRVGNWLYGNFRGDYLSESASTYKWAIDEVSGELQASFYAPGCYSPMMRRDNADKLTRADVTITEKNGLSELRGELIRAILELYYGRILDTDDNYMDHVYSVTIEGQNGQVIQEQTQANGVTFGALGLADDFTAVFPAMVRLTVDDQLKTQTELGV